MIEFKLVDKRFGSKLILSRVNFKIEKGEIVFVIGKSGMGKSVTLKLLVGLLEPDSGEVWIDGNCVNRSSEEELLEIRKKCGMVFQNPALLDSLSVFDNIAFGLRAHKILTDVEQIHARVVEKLKVVGLDQSLLEKFPGELSFGMQKRISIARTLALEPEYLLFDEPTTGQDPIGTRALNDLIRKLSLELGVTSLVVSHDMHCALEISNRILLLDRGEIVEEGTPQAFLRSPQPLAKQFLAEANARSFDEG